MTLEKINTIIADDSPQFIEAIELMLSTSSKYIITDKVMNGLDLLNSPKLGTAKLILTDIEMPLLNGIEAARRINYLHPKIKMIAITMYLDKIYLKEIIEAGFRGFIYKPNLAENLFSVIDAVLEERISIEAQYLQIENRK